MQAMSSALNPLFEDGTWFVRAREVKLWTVRVSSEVRKPALRVVTGMEFLEDNRSAWVTLPDAHTAADPGWQVRANRVVAHWEERRKAFREREQIEMPEARLQDPDPDKSAPAPMPVACAAVVKALRAPLDGLVIVLAPAAVEDVNAMGSEIEALLRVPALEACRWVWVLDAESAWPDLLERLGDRGLRSECIPDPETQKKDYAALLAAPPTKIGRAAPPGITPPRRITEPPPMAPEERAAALRAEGINPEYCEKAPELQRLILAAAIAMKNGDAANAVRQQQAASDLAFSLEAFDVTVLCRVALGSYLMGSERREEALDAFHSAAALAREHGLTLQESQAYLGAGVLLALAGRYDDSAEAYTSSARCAETAKVPVLAIEGFRMAGQVSLQSGNDGKACESFREAIRVAEAAEVEAVKDSTASEAALKLAEIYDRLEMPEQAESLRAHAQAMERGEVGIDEPVLVEA